MLPPAPEPRGVVSVRSGEQRDGPEPREGDGELVGPRPARRQVEGDPASRAGQSPGESEQPPVQGLRGDDARTEPEPAGSAGEASQ